MNEPHSDLCGEFLGDLVAREDYAFRSDKGHGNLLRPATKSDGHSTHKLPVASSGSMSNPGRSPDSESFVDRLSP